MIIKKIKVSELDEATELGDNDYVYVVSSGVSKKIKLKDFLLQGELKSNPPAGMKKVVNIYIDPVLDKVVVEYEG